MEALANMNTENLSKKDLAKFKQLEKDPLMSQLISKLVQNEIKVAIEKSNEKKICPASVKMGKKKALELLENGNEKYELYIFQEEGQKTQVFTQCTRPQYQDEKHCWKHCQVYSENPDNVIAFDKIKENDNSREADADDEFFKATPVKKSANKEFINFIRSDEMIKIFKEAIGDAIGNLSEANEDDEQSETEANDVDDEDEDEQSEAEAKDDEEDEDEQSETEAKDDEEVEEANEADEDAEEAEDDEDEEDEEDEDEDGLECKEITTSDGRLLYLDDKTQTIYSPDGDDGGSEMGTLVAVSDKTSLEIDGKSHIVAKPINYQKKEYQRCVLSDKLYQKVGKQLKQVGKVQKLKNGDYKVTLSATGTNKKQPTKKGKK